MWYSLFLICCSLNRVPVSSWTISNGICEPCICFIIQINSMKCVHGRLNRFILSIFFCILHLLTVYVVPSIHSNTHKNYDWIEIRFFSIFFLKVFTFSFSTSIFFLFVHFFPAFFRFFLRFFLYSFRSLAELLPDFDLNIFRIFCAVRKRLLLWSTLCVWLIGINTKIPFYSKFVCQTHSVEPSGIESCSGIFLLLLLVLFLLL